MKPAFEKFKKTYFKIINEEQLPSEIDSSYNVIDNKTQVATPEDTFIFQPSETPVARRVGLKDKCLKVVTINEKGTYISRILGFYKYEAFGHFFGITWMYNNGKKVWDKLPEEYPDGPLNRDDFKEFYR